jgi:hypothetical protein
VNFESTRNSGFKIKFPNGLVLSTQFGSHNYCDNYTLKTEESSKTRDGGYACDNVEIAVFYDDPAKHDWMTQEVLGENIGDDVKGYVDINEWLEIFEKVKNYKGKEVTPR